MLDKIEAMRSLEQKAQFLVEAIEDHRPIEDLAHSARNLLVSLTSLRRLAEREARTNGDSRVLASEVSR